MCNFVKSDFQLNIFFIKFSRHFKSIDTDEVRGQLML